MSMLRLAADYESAREIGPWLQTTLQALESRQHARVGELELAIHEVAINIVDHAFGDNAAGQHYTISLDEDDGPEQIRVELRDQGREFVAGPAPDLAEPQVGGYGLFIAEQLASSLSYERVDATNIWTLIFTTPSSNESSPTQETQP